MDYTIKINSGAAHNEKFQKSKLQLQILGAGRLQSMIWACDLLWFTIIHKVHVKLDRLYCEPKNMGLCNIQYGEAKIAIFFT